MSTDMTMLSNLPGTSHEPGWVGQLRGVLASRDAAEAVPAPEPDPLIDIARTAAFAWLGKAGVDAAKRITEQFGNAQDIQARWAISSGVDPVPTLDISVWRGRDAIFRYSLRLVTDSDGVRPKISVRAGLGSPRERAFGPWINGATTVTSITKDEVASDFASAFSEAMTA